MDDLHSKIRDLESTGDYIVLRRLKPQRLLRQSDGTRLYDGLFVDCETTGLDPKCCETIEVALLPFQFALDGRIFSLGQPYVGRQQPSGSLPQVVQDLTGLTMDDLAERKFDDPIVQQLVIQSSLIIAHHADFDRRFLERRFPVFRTKPWACSLEDVNWRAEGYESTKLSFLAMKCGFFYPEHSAGFDALAGIELLNTELVSTGRPAMAQLLEKLQKDTTRLFVRRVPFGSNGLLRDRGYHFSREGGEATWSIDLDRDRIEDEERFLAEIGLVATRRALSPLDRFSDRS